MTSNDYKFLFVHVGKNAGNTITKSLIEYSDDEILVSKWFHDGEEMFDVFNPLHGTRKHASLSEYKEAMPEYVYEKYYKFAVVRNPWDRLISIYYAPNRVAQGKVDLNDFDKKDFMRIVGAQRTFRQFVTTNPRSELCGELDRVVSFENLREGFYNVVNDLRLPRLSLGEGNKSKREKDYRCYYDEEMRDAVLEKFGEEIRYFGYSF